MAKAGLYIVVYAGVFVLIGLAFLISETAENAGAIMAYGALCLCYGFYFVPWMVDRWSDG